MIKKPSIFFCDDKPKWTDQFKKWHQNVFEIETTNSGIEFTRILKNKVRAGKLPDIILIDLYHQKGECGSAKQIELEKIGEKAIGQLEAAIKEAKVPILEAWHPYGYDMMEAARDLYPNVPIAIYTEQGLTLADDKELERVSKCDTEWFLKGKSAFYESRKLAGMLTNRTVTRDKPLIYFCDDKPKWTNQLKQWHEVEFEIETSNDGREFLHTLKKKAILGEIPDIILIDLYHPIGERGSVKQTELEKIGEKAIEQLETAIKDAKVPILEAWHPYGYDMMETARELCPNVPIAIYTEQGLTLADDKELERVSKYNTEWFLKGKSDFYENYRLERMLQYKKKKDDEYKKMRVGGYEIKEVM